MTNVSREKSCNPMNQFLGMSLKQTLITITRECVVPEVTVQRFGTK